MFTGSSPFSDYVDTTFLTIVGISSLVLLGLVVAMIYFLFRYSRKRNPHPTNIEGNVPLEVAWTVIPLVLFMGMFYMGWEGYRRMSEIPDRRRADRGDGADVDLVVRVPERTADRHAVSFRCGSRSSSH